MKRIGTNYFNYATIRNFTGLIVEGYQFRKVNDPSKLIEFPLFKLFNKIPFLIHNVFIDIPGHSVQAFHFFNTTYFGHKPWVLTIEDIAPRFGTKKRRLISVGLKRMAADNCKAILAMSKNSYNRQLFLLEDYPLLKAKIVSKMSVLHPAQRLFLNDISEKTYDPGNIRFTFVGRSFFRKGGLEMLRAADRLLIDGYRFTLNIVSRFELTQWLDDHITTEHHDEARRLINKYPDYFTYVAQISNSEVLELMKGTDVGVLPSYGESYGYSVLEAQAYGCPVITTNVWALEEINNNEKGWVIEVPRIFREGGYESDIEAPEKLKHFSQQMEEKLYHTMKHIIMNPSSVRIKGQVAIRDIREKHSPEKAGARLKMIYDEATSSVSQF